MKRYFYLTATPEALICSMLPPEEFGNYFVVEAEKRSGGQAIYFEVDPELIPGLPVDYIEEKCVPYEGRPKRSAYVSIYRSMELVPMEAFKGLYLVTDDGKVLILEKDEYIVEKPPCVYMYQQINPLATRVVSKLTPPEFVKFLTDETKPVSAPKIFFAHLKLEHNDHDPCSLDMILPYMNVGHLKRCIDDLMKIPEKATKTVLRSFNEDLSFQTIGRGFFIGDKEDFHFYPFPSADELETKHYTWWRSAMTLGFK